MESLRIVIVGAGIGGAATAWSLAQRGIRGVTLFEREKDPGAHSTGRNAAILRSAIEDPALHALARESARFYRQPPPGFTDHPLVDPVGLYMAAPSGAEQTLLSWTGRKDCQAGLTQVDPSEIYARIPPLSQELKVAFHQADEGVMDVAGILSGFLRGARAGGARLRTGERVCAVLHEAGRVTGVETDSGTVEADVVVLAGGAWAAELAAEAGFPLPLTPYRRHLLVTQRLSEVDPRWPVVWIGGEEFYFRPESGGLLVSPCDTTPMPPDQAETVDPDQMEVAAQKTARWLPTLLTAGAAHFWAGARTFAPDHRFLVGPDPRLHGLHWVAGLAGHGISCAHAVGQIAASWMLEGASGHPSARFLLPERLVDRTGVLQE